MDARPINQHEQALPNAILASSSDGFDALRAQIPHAQVVPGCACGCGTIDFVFDHASLDLPRSDAANPIHVSPTVIDDGGEVIGSLIVFLKNGMLASLEVVSYADPLPLPALDHLDWDAIA